MVAKGALAGVLAVVSTVVVTAFGSPAKSDRPWAGSASLASETAPRRSMTPAAWRKGLPDHEGVVRTGSLAPKHCGGPSPDHGPTCPGREAGTSTPDGLAGRDLPVSATMAAPASLSQEEPKGLKRTARADRAKDQSRPAKSLPGIARGAEPASAPVNAPSPAESVRPAPMPVQFELASR